MSADVGAANDRLNGLVNLLKVVGVDSLDDLGGGGGANKSNTTGATALTTATLGDAASLLNDDQIETIIKKLQMAQSEAPQIIAALEARKQQGESKSGSSNFKENAEALRQQQPVVDQPDEEEEDDEDGDGNFPVVGPGCSDDISIVSDLTTPTVVSSLNVPDEEHYQHNMPPMIIGGGGGRTNEIHLPPMLIQPSKRKNLVNQVNSRGGYGGHQGYGSGQQARRSHLVRGSGGGGAAAARLKNYQETMNRLQQQQQHENPSYRTGLAGPAKAPSNKSLLPISCNAHNSQNTRVTAQQLQQHKLLKKAPIKSLTKQSSLNSKSRQSTNKKPAISRSISNYEGGDFGTTKQQQKSSSQASDEWGFSAFDDKGFSSPKTNAKKSDDGFEFDPFSTDWPASPDELGGSGGGKSSSRSSKKKASGAFPPSFSNDGDGFVDAFGLPLSNDSDQRRQNNNKIATPPSRRSRKEGEGRKTSRSSKASLGSSGEQRKQRRSRRAPVAT